MAIAVATRDYQRAQVALRSKVYAETVVVWRLLDPERLDTTFPRFAASMLQLIQGRREASATLARRYLVAQRAGVPGSTPPVDTPSLDADGALMALRFSSVVSMKVAAKRGTPTQQATRNALVRTLGTVDKCVGDAGRELIRESVRVDPAAKGWLRRTLGTCEYCAEKAQGEHVQPDTADFPRHDHCGCQPEPVYDVPAVTANDAADLALLRRRLASDNRLRRRTPSANPTSATEDDLRALLADPNLPPKTKYNIRVALSDLAEDRADMAALRVVEEAKEAASQAATQTATERGALLSSEQYEALRPTSAWSEEQRANILTSLRQTEEGRVLADTLERFQDGGSIARLRTKIDKYLAGADIDPTSKARAEALLNAIEHSPNWAPDKLYRGMTVKGNIDNVLKKYTSGGSIDLNLTSFSADRSVATRFQQMTATGKGAETKVMVELVGEGKRAIPIQNLPRDHRLFREKEWVSAGRYEVVEVKKSGGAILLRVKQVGTVKRR